MMSKLSLEPSPDAEMRTPQIGSPGLIVFYGIALALIALALHNLWQFDSVSLVSLVASGLWLLLSGVLLVANCRDEGGPIQYLINRLGQFGAQQFAWIERHEEQPVLCIGYHLFGRRFYYLRIRGDRIKYVNWNTGQATALAGRDMSDWSVVVHYEPGRGDCLGDSWGLYILGPTGPKETTAEFGHSLVRFLNQAGIELFPTKNECKFAREDLAGEN